MPTDGRTPDDVLLDRAFELFIRLIERHLEAETNDQPAAEEPEE